MKKLISSTTIQFLLVFISSFTITIIHSFGSNAFNSLITLFSIFIGFTLSSLAIISSSKFSKELYQKELPNDNSKTSLHVLINDYKVGLWYYLTTIIAIIIYQNVYNKVDTSSPIVLTFTIDLSFRELTSRIVLKLLLESFIWTLTLISLFKTHKLFDYLCKIALQEGKNQDNQ